MKIVKGIAIYTGIILGAILILGVVLMGLMFIFPSFGLFGYNFQYKSMDSTLFSNIDFANYETDDMKLSTSSPVVNLYINNGNYNLILKPTKYGELQSYVESNYAGFVKTESGVFETTLIADGVVVKNSATGKNELNLTLDLNGPKGGVVFRGGNDFYVSVPYEYNGKVVSYNITANADGGDVTLQNSDNKNEFDRNLNAVSFNISTGRGNVVIKGLQSKEEGGKIVENKEVTIKSMSISTKGGVVDLSNFDKLTIEEKLLLKSTRADYVFKKLIAEKGIEIVGDNVRFQADEVTAREDGFVYKSATGGLDIGKLNCSNVDIDNYVEQGNDTYKLEYRVNDGGSYTNIESGTNWAIKYVNYESTILTDSAQIDIDELIGKFGIENEYGNITIKHCTNQGSIRNEHGNVTINTSGYFNDSKVGTAGVQYAPTSSLIIYNGYGKIYVGKYFQNGVFTTENGDIECYSAYKMLDSNNNKHYYTNILTDDGNVVFESEGNACSVISTGKSNITAKITNVTKHISTDSILFEGEQVNYGFKVNSGNLNVTLPSAGNSFDIKASGNVNGYVTTSTPIENNILAKINYVSGQPNVVYPAYVRLIGGDVEIRGSY